MDFWNIFILSMTTTLQLISALKDLHIMGLLTMSREVVSKGGPACLVPILMAFRHINERNDILSDYKLNFDYEDTGCDVGRAIDAMYEMLYSGPTKHMILGPACSGEAEAAAQASRLWNLTHLSNAAGSPLLSNRNLFPRFFRVLSSDARYNQLRLALARAFNWKRIATINQATDYHSAITDDLVKSVRGSDITIISQEIFERDPTTRLQSLKAYTTGLYGSKVVWMFPGWYPEKWWVVTKESVSCSEEELATVVEGSLYTGFFTYNPIEERGIANLTVTEFFELFHEEENYNKDTLNSEFISGDCYDTVWGIGLTLHCTDLYLKKIGHPKSLDQFEYSDQDIGDIITSCITNLSFTGISGNMEFGVSGDSKKLLRLDQIQNGQKVLVGVYDTDVEHSFIQWQNGGIRWKDGVAPRDSTLVTTVEALIPQQLYIVMSCFSALGILLAIVFLAFSIKHRNHAYVKLSSPNINNVLLLGCIITYSWVFMDSLERKSIGLCKLRTFTLTIGFSVSFGALFSKTWRVYRIFSNKKLLQIRIKDSQLICTVLGVAGAQIFVLLLQEILDPTFIVIRFLRSEVYVIGNDAEIHMFIRECTSHHSIYFSWTIYITEGILLSFGAFLAFETRKVKIAALNDSRLIGTCLYNVVVLSAVGLTLNLVLQEQVALLYGIMSALLIIGTTATQLIVFIPKVTAVYFPSHMTVHPDGKQTMQAIDISVKANQSQGLVPRAPTRETAQPTKQTSTDSLC